MSASAVMGDARSRPVSLRARFGNPAWLLVPATLFLAFIYLLPLIDLTRISLSGPTPLGYFDRVFSVPLYWDSLVRTMGISLSVAVLCAIFGYPTALLIHRTRGWVQAVVAVSITLPYFIAILIRTYSWMVLLGRNGPVNKFAVWLGIFDGPMHLLFNRGAVLLGMTAVLLPIMVLSIYASVARLDSSLTRAAAASGAGPLAVFWRVMLPLTFPGVGAGFLLVFVMGIGFFITPTLLGGPGDQMFAMHITQQSNFVSSEGFLQALGVVLLVITVIFVGIAGHFLGFEFLWGGGKLSGDGSAKKREKEAGGRIASGHTLGTLLADTIGWPILRALSAAPRWFGGATVISSGLLVIAILVVPIIVVMIISFSEASFLSFPPRAYSLRWYEEFFTDSAWVRAFRDSLTIAVISALIAVVLGTAAAMGVVRSSIRGKTFIMLFLVSPVIVPPVVLGLSLYSLYLRVGLDGTIGGLAAAHAIGGLPIVVVIICAALQSVDRNLERAAAVHGASPLTVFRTVTLPAIAPGLAAATFFAFLHSFDELVLSLFLTSPRLVTLPLKLWAGVNYELSPVLAVVSTLEVLLVVVGIFLARRVLNRARKKA